MVKPDIHGEEMCICSRGNNRGDWGERASKDCKGAPRRSDDWVEPNFLQECITVERVSRKSEGIIVAMKWM